MRRVPPGLLEHLGGETLYLALALKIKRLDGAILGFTSHDSDLDLGDGVVYEATSSMQSSSMRQEIGTGVDNLNALGVLNSVRIKDIDLLAGRYNGASISLYLVRWDQKPIAEKLNILEGTLGDISVGDGFYTVEVRSLMQRLTQNVGELTSPTCRVRTLFDERCSPPGNTTPTAHPENFRFHAAVASVASNREMTFTGVNQPPGYFASGRVVFQTGQNVGLEREVKSDAGGGGALILQEAFPYAFAPGEQVMLEAGCDRLIDTCRVKFQNVLNLRAEPYVPGLSFIISVGRHQVSP